MKTGIPIMRCGKCKNQSIHWTKEFHDKKEFSYRCPNCKDLIDKNAVKQVGVFK